MGAYIKGMKMPTRCWDCLLNTYGYCMTSGEHSDIIPSDAPIPEWCPLVPVPPHGRLIAEADAVETTWMILRGLGYLKEENPKLEQTVREVFATAPAIEVEEHG